MIFESDPSQNDRDPSLLRSSDCFSHPKTSSALRVDPLVALVRCLARQAANDAIRESIDAVSQKGDLK
jgi:hypothetical protein